MKMLYKRIAPKESTDVYNYKNRGIRLEAHIADIHFGVMNPKLQFDILVEQFLNRIFKLKLDIISINGDLFDHKFMSNSDAVFYAIQFIDMIVNYCRNTGCTLMLLHGTMSHDANQLKLFYRYLGDPTVDARIISDNVRIEYVKDKKILCIPELYGRGYDYYYSALYNNGYYDSCILHGTIAGSIYGKDFEDLDSQREPVFSIDSFGYCLGPIIAGHVHVPQCIQNHIYYTGSPIRDRFGEEQPKGFSILLHNLDTREYCLRFEEIKSFRYDTVNLDDIIDKDPREIIAYIDNLKSQGIDNLRVEFTKPSENIQILKNYYRPNSSVFIKDDMKARELAVRNKTIEEKYNQYSYILDKNLSEYEILVKYINQNMGHTYITVDELMQILK